MDKNFIMQVRFNPEDIQFKTITTMDRAARLATSMMPDSDTLAVLSTLSILGRWAGPAICEIEMK